MQYLSAVSKNDKMISVYFQGKPFSITVIQVYAPTTNAKEAEQFYEDLQDLLELTSKKKKKENRLNQNRSIIHPTREKSMGQGEVLEPEHTTLLGIQAI